MKPVCDMGEHWTLKRVEPSVGLILETWIGEMDTVDHIHLPDGRLITVERTTGLFVGVGITKADKWKFEGGDYA